MSEKDLKKSAKKITPQQRWDKVNTKRYVVPVMKTTEQDIIKKLDSVDNKSGYIKSLIRADIAENGYEKW